MALPTKQIDSIVSQLHKFGENDLDFDRWMSTIVNVVRAHGDVGMFRTEARSLWLARNKKGLERLVRDLLEGPSAEEQAQTQQKGVSRRAVENVIYSWLADLGVSRGDTLTLHNVHGQVVSICLDDERLPESL